mgnify:CR=1 FL=1
MTILIFLIVLSVLVLVHEWGHFVTAQRAGVKVEEFGFGFPPTTVHVKHGPGRKQCKENIHTSLDYT